MNALLDLVKCKEIYCIAVKNVIPVQLENPQPPLAYSPSQES